MVNPEVFCKLFPSNCTIGEYRIDSNETENFCENSTETYNGNLDRLIFSIFFFNGIISI